MFGLSFGELVVLLIVAVMVLGPKELPVYLRKAGVWAGRLRRMAFEMREKSGIDEVLRTEGLDRDIAEIRRLARGELGSVAGAVRAAMDPLRPATLLGGLTASPGTERDATPGAGAEPSLPGVMPASPEASLPPHLAAERAREYPPEGPDAYGALPDTAVVYEGGLAESPLAADSLYTRGEAA